MDKYEKPVTIIESFKTTEVLTASDDETTINGGGDNNYNDSSIG